MRMRFEMVRFTEFVFETFSIYAFIFFMSTSYFFTYNQNNNLISENLGAWIRMMISRRIDFHLQDEPTGI